MLLQGDALNQLKVLSDNSVDLLCTDPPYGYSFMGKDWDKAVPSVEVWEEVLRVLKPGAFAFVMSAPRSDVQWAMIDRLQQAGFRLDFTPIYWTYASGFPKAMNIGKMVDKRAGVEREVVGIRKTKAARKMNGGNFLNSGMELVPELPVTEPSTPAAKALDGSYGGFQPKPAVEVIIVAMKPLSEKTYVDQALANGKGITWLDDCRVPVGNETVPRLNKAYERKGGLNFGDGEDGRLGTTTGHESTGRFPANLIVSDDVLNDGRVTKSTGGQSSRATGYGALGEGTREVLKGVNPGLGDTGSYSRYFDLDAWAKTLPFLIVPKAAKSEKNEGTEHLPVRQSTGGAAPSSAHGSIKAPGSNFHPTVKPLKLMSYLITLGSRPGDVVLDPFLGSGTTAIAAKQLGRVYIGIEREAEYMDIAQARLLAAKSPEPELFAAE